MGTGLESALLSLGSMASLANSNGLLGIKMLDKVLDANTQAAATIISDMASMPAPGAGELGGLLDVRA